MYHRPLRVVRNWVTQHLRLPAGKDTATLNRQPWRPRQVCNNTLRDAVLCISFGGFTAVNIELLWNAVPWIYHITLAYVTTRIAGAVTNFRINIAIAEGPRVPCTDTSQASEPSGF